MKPHRALTAALAVAPLCVLLAPATVLADPAVREVFLGTEVTAALAGGSLESPSAADGDGAAGGERSQP